MDNNPPGATSLTSVTAIPCSQAHNAQIYAKFNLSGSDFSYPGTPAVTRLATSGCNGDPACGCSTAVPKMCASCANVASSPRRAADPSTSARRDPATG